MLDFISMIALLILYLITFLFIVIVIVCNYASSINETPKEKFYKDEEQMKIVSSDEYKNKFRRKKDEIKKFKSN